MVNDLKAAKKVNDDALSKAITIRISNKKNELLVGMAEADQMSISEFIRKAVEEKIGGTEIADSLNSVINAGIQRIEEVARNNSINQEILRSVENLQAIVALKSDFEEHEINVLSKVSEIINKFDTAFLAQATGFETLIKSVQETVKNHQTKEINMLDMILVNQKVLASKYAEINENLKNSIPGYEEVVIKS